MCPRGLVGVLLEGFQAFCSVLGIEHRMPSPHVIQEAGAWGLPSSHFTIVCDDAFGAHMSSNTKLVCPSTEGILKKDVFLKSGLRLPRVSP